MKIAFVAPYASARMGGAEQLLSTLSEALAERHDVKIIARRVALGDAAPAETERRTVPIDILPWRPFEPILLAPIALGRTGLALFRSRWYARFVRWLYVRVRARRFMDVLRPCDVVHLWMPGLFGEAARVAARRLGKPVVLTPLAHPGQWGEDFVAIQQYREVDRVLALLSVDVPQYEAWGTAPERIAVTGAATPAPPPNTSADHVALDGPVVLFVGHRRPHKGVELLLAAARQLEAEGAALNLVLAGPGEAIRTEDAPRGLIDLGRVPDEERWAWMRRADVLALPSAHESFGLVLMEAWSVGTPVITSTIPTLASLVEESGAGLTADRSPSALAEAINMLIADAELRERLGAAGRRFYERYGAPHVVAAAHESVYQEVLGSRLRRLDELAVS